MSRVLGLVLAVCCYEIFVTNPILSVVVNWLVKIIWSKDSGYSDLNCVIL